MSMLQSINWQGFSNKVLRALFTIAMVAFWTACADDSQNLSGPDADALSASQKSTSSFNDYTISVSVSTDGKVWTYTITKKAGAKKLSHFIIDLENCTDPNLESAKFGDIDHATVNNEPADFVSTEGQGTSCDPEKKTSNFVKIAGPFADVNAWVIVIYYDRGYLVADGSLWLKAGTSCNTEVVTGAAPGCPITDYCSLSQGYFFANGSFSNGAEIDWAVLPGVEIGGRVYSQAEGNAFWNANKGLGANDIIRSFFQLGALKLSGVAPAELSAEMAVIDTWFASQPRVTLLDCTKTVGKKTTVYKCFNIGTAPAEVQAAAGKIGQWINANHCNDDEG